MKKDGAYKIVFFGTPEFAAPLFEHLRRDPDFEIVAVVTQPDKPSGRKKRLTAPTVKRAAVMAGVPVYQPESLKKAEVVAHLKNFGADAFVVAAYGKLLPEPVLDIPRYGCINVHASILPKYRGASPISSAIAAGERETGVSIMRMNEKLDEGPVLAVTKIAIEDGDTAESLAHRLAEAGAELLGPTLKLYFRDELTPVPQNHAGASYAKILKRDDGRVDWSRSAEEIERFVRAMQPWPQAFFFWKPRGKRSALKIILKKTAVLHPDSKCDTVGRPGSACRLGDGSMGINCGRGSLSVLRLQLEGKSETDGKSFLNGYPDIIGAALE